MCFCISSCRYVSYFNNQRIHAVLGYKSPGQHKTEPGYFYYLFSLSSFAWQLQSLA